MMERLHVANNLTTGSEKRKTSHTLLLLLLILFFATADRQKNSALEVQQMLKMDALD